MKFITPKIYRISWKSRSGDSFKETLLAHNIEEALRLGNLRLPDWPKSELACVEDTNTVILDYVKETP